MTAAETFAGTRGVAAELTALFAALAKLIGGLTLLAHTGGLRRHRGNGRWRRELWTGPGLVILARRIQGLALRSTAAVLPISAFPAEPARVHTALTTHLPAPLLCGGLQLRGIVLSWRNPARTFL